MVVVSHLELCQYFSKDAEVFHVVGSAAPVLISAPMAQENNAQYKALVMFVSEEC